MASSEIMIPNSASLEQRNTTFAPRTINEALTFAEMLLDSGMLPKSYKDATPATIVVVLQHGMEVGFQPMQALQCIANINGMPSIWGDGALALVRSSGLLEDIQEDDFEIIKKNQKATCIVKRRGDPRPKQITFSYQDAKDAGIFGNAVWKTYPYRMAMMRARAFALRDKFPDVLKGLRIAEEVSDYTELDANPNPQPTKTPTPISSDPVQRDPEDEVLGKEWATSFYRTYSKSGWLPEESKTALQEVCGITDSRLVTKKHGETMMKWASTPKPKPEPTPPEDGKYDFGDFGQDEPGSNG